MCFAAMFDGAPNWVQKVVDPVSAVAGKNSLPAKINKTLLDPGGLVLSGDTVFGKKATGYLDPMGWGDGARQKTESQYQYQKALMKQQSDLQKNMMLQNQGLLR